MSNEEQNKVSEEVQKIVDEKGAQFEACLLKALQIAENTEGHNPKVKFHDEQVTTWAQSIFNDIWRDLRGKSIEASKQKNPGGNRFPRFNVPSKTGGYGASAGKSGSAAAPAAVATATEVIFVPATANQVNALLRMVSSDAQKAVKTPEAYLEEFLGKSLALLSKQEASASFDKLKK